MYKAAILRKSLDLLFYSGVSHAFAGSCRGIGAIFMLHHIRPGGGNSDGFAPNAGLEVTPEFLDDVIQFTKNNGYDIVSLDEVVTRLRGDRTFKRPFAVFTIDDGYRDNYEHAWPVFAKHDCPFTIFISPAITDGICCYWDVICTVSWKG